MRLSQVVKDIKSAKEFIKENKIEPEYCILINKMYGDIATWYCRDIESIEDMHNLKEIIIVWEETK